MVSDYSLVDCFHYSRLMVSDYSLVGNSPAAYSPDSVVQFWALRQVPATVADLPADRIRDSD